MKPGPTRQISLLFLIVFSLCLPQFIHARELSGRIVAPDFTPIAGASIHLLKTDIATVSNANGNFTLPLRFVTHKAEHKRYERKGRCRAAHGQEKTTEAEIREDILRISKCGFVTKKIALDKDGCIGVIVLEPSAKETAIFKTLSLFDGGIDTEWISEPGPGCGFSNGTLDLAGAKRNIRTSSTNQAYSFMQKEVHADIDPNDNLVLILSIDTLANLSFLNISFGDKNLDDAATIELNNYGGLVEGPDTIALPWNAFADKSGIVPWDSVVTLQIAVCADSGKSVSVDLCGLFSRKNTAHKATCMFTFDDGWINQYTTAKPIMDAHGFAGTAFIIGDQAAHPYDSVMNMAQLHDLQNNGWDIANHTKTHADLTTLDSAGVITEIKGCADFLKCNGFKAYNLLAYPYGSYDTKVIGFVHPYCVAARSTDENPTETETIPFYDPYHLRVAEISDTTSLAYAQSILDLAISRRAAIIFVFHGIVDTPSTDTDWATDRFKAFMNYVDCKTHEGLVDVTTLGAFSGR